MVCANEFDLEALVVSTSCWPSRNPNSRLILDDILDSYEQVYGNLSVHAEGYPSPSYLRSISGLGQTGYSMDDVGPGKDTFGSNAIIEAVDKVDLRPVWVQCWGGANTVPQALWKVRETRPVAAIAQFVSRLRVYDILGQDEAGAWITKTFPGLIYIRFKRLYDWQYSDNWIDSNIRNHGVLGSTYPDSIYAVESSSPAFFYLYPNGLSYPDMVNWGGWGGRCSPDEVAGLRGVSAVANEYVYDTYYMYSDAPEGGGSIGTWSGAIANDFAARMDWSIESNYSNANHHPVAGLDGGVPISIRIWEITASPDSSVSLSADGSYDPDGDSLSYLWSYYSEPSSYGGPVNITNSHSSSASVLIPSDAGGSSIHIILTVSDDGSPNLCAYRRLVIKVNQQ